MYDMDEKNTVYLKANWLHQFAGNYGVTLTNGNDSLRKNWQWNTGMFWTF